jgi:NCAIR mutase (PurE)-related protein
VSEFEIDWDRERRTGIAEAVLCDSKTPAQIEAILAASEGRCLFLTRLSEQTLAALPPGHRSSIDYDPSSRTGMFGLVGRPTRSGAGIVCAGTSDLAVAHEAARTLAFAGFDAPVIADVGVAGLWRLQRRLEAIRAFRIVIAIAGMEGALFSVLAGLIAAPIIAVPTSVGYGVAAGGHAALQSALASCAPGIVVVNIDSGFGAACAALRMLRSGPA